MSKLGDFDINEVILQLHKELKLAFEIAQSAEQQSGLRMENVKARFGRKLIDEVNGQTENSEEDVEVLNGDRYPNEEDWEVEVEYKHGLPVPGLPQSQNWVSSESSKIVIERLTGTSLIHVKGVNQVWLERFRQLNISTIEQIVASSYEEIQVICNQYHTLKPLEIQIKVSLLVRDFIPLAHEEFKHLSLIILLNNSLEKLKSIFKNRLSGPEISSLKAMASIIYLVFDKRFVEKLDLSLLSK